ncbi:MAG: hypothetical protein Q7V88_06785 [Actinomycetota bacterium]|nr:hypothetical protein [Actinomycetota bacterium]
MVAPTAPPAACYQATIEHEPVEVLVTDDGVLVDGLPAPECIQVPESFAMTFINNAEGDATIGFGDGGAVLAAGDSETSDPLGEMFFVGDHFQISVAELGAVIDVEVIAA